MIYYISRSRFHNPDTCSRRKILPLSSGRCPVASILLLGRGLDKKALACKGKGIELKHRFSKRFKECS